MKTKEEFLTPRYEGFEDIRSDNSRKCCYELYRLELLGEIDDYHTIVCNPNDIFYNIFFKVYYNE